VFRRGDRGGEGGEEGGGEEGTKRVGHGCLRLKNYPHYSGMGAHFAACAGNPAALSCCGESTRLTRRMNAKWNES